MIILIYSLPGQMGMEPEIKVVSFFPITDIWSRSVGKGQSWIANRSWIKFLFLALFTQSISECSKALGQQFSFNFLMRHFSQNILLTWCAFNWYSLPVVILSHWVSLSLCLRGVNLPVFLSQSTLSTFYSDFKFPFFCELAFLQYTRLSIKKH